MPFLRASPRPARQRTGQGRARSGSASRLTSGALLTVSGTPSNSIFTLGPALRGQLDEATIPEIRDQAALAGRLLAVCRARVASLAAPGQSGMAGSVA